MAEESIQDTRPIAAWLVGGRFGVSMYYKETNFLLQLELSGDTVLAELEVPSEQGKVLMGVDCRRGGVRATVVGIAESWDEGEFRPPWPVERAWHIDTTEFAFEPIDASDVTCEDEHMAVDLSVVTPPGQS